MSNLCSIPAPPLSAGGRTGRGALSPAGEKAEGRAVFLDWTPQLLRGEVRV